jgi:chromosomal replication initiation ATPase DnaA
MNRKPPPVVDTDTLVSKPMLERLITATCSYFAIQEDELKEGKSTDQVYKKHLCWYLIKENVVISHHRIGQRFNIADASTVRRAIEKIQVHKNIYAQTLHDIRQIEKIANTLED